MEYYPSRYYTINPNTGVPAPITKTQFDQFQNGNPYQNMSKAIPVAKWSKALLFVGLFVGLTLIVALIVIPVYLYPLLSATTTTTTTTLTTVTISTTSIVTMYIPNNYWTACNSSCTNVSTSTASTLIALWDFENNLSENTNTYNGTMNNAGSSPYVSGYINQAFASETTTYVSSTGSLNLANTSFTLEAWIMITSYLNSTVLYGLFGQCQTTAVRKCLHLDIRYNRLYFGVYSDDLNGTTFLSLNVWTHVAFMYDMTTSRKSIYLNGILDATITSIAFQGIGGTILIGAVSVGTTTSRFPGFIDQVKLSNRAKTACEIYNDATLVSYYTFDNTINDIGPNILSSYITGQSNNGISYINGRVNQGIMFSKSNSFFQSYNYHFLSLTNQPYSFSLWINPNISAGTILHLSSDRTGSSSWCLPMIGFASNGSLVIQSWNGAVVSLYGPQIPSNNWTHIIYTWSSTNGLKLYINGDLFSSISMLTYVNNNGNSMCIFIGSNGLGTNCQTSGIMMGSYVGAVDEFYVYNRELTLNDICTLAHP